MEIKFNDLKGRVIIDVKISSNQEELLFTLDNGDIYRMYHSQSCCEYVSIDDINGDWEDIIGYEIFNAEEVTSDSFDEEKEKDCESCTWTFYKLATMKGYMTIRWFGSSNGYYSEGVDFEYIETNEEIATRYFREKKLERIIKN